MKTFYTYLWLRGDGTPYYVGKGSGIRAFTSWAHGVHCPPDKNRILIQEHVSEEEAFEAEAFFIEYYGRLWLGTGCLRNIAGGGQNPPKANGRVWTEEHKIKMRNRFQGIPLLEEHRKKLSEAHMGQAAWNKGVPNAEKTRKKISIANKGRKRSHCRKRHEFTEENTLTGLNGRRCKICRTESSKRAYIRAQEKRIRNGNFL